MSTSTSSSTSSSADLETLGDAELISAVRGGDVQAYGALFERHVEAARRLARQLVSAGDVEDLVSEAFIKVLHVLQRGGGPDVAFRAYLLTAVRRLRVDRLRATSRLHTTDDMDAFDPGVPFRDTAVEGFENAAAARAFASLPERWQLVLWHTEVEGSKPADIAPLLGMSANSVSALAYRAREGLRQAFLTQHAGELEEDECRWTHEHLGAYIRNGTARRDATRVEQHLGECRSCMAVYLELSDINSNLAGIIAPLLLGGLAAAYVGQAAAGGIAVSTGVSAVVGRVRDAVVAHTAASSVAGVAATVAVVGGAMTIGAGAPDRPVALSDPPAAAAPEAGAPLPTVPTSPEPAPGDRSRTSPAGRTPLVITLPEPIPTTAPEPGEPLPVPSPTPSEAPTPAPAGPTQGPTQAPTEAPADGPSAEPTTDPIDLPTEVPTRVPDPVPTTVPTVPVPTGPPASTPTPDPTPNPTPDPTPDPSPDPPAPAPDASVGAAVSGSRPNYTVTVTVAGLPTGATGTLTVSADDVATIRTQDPRCEQQAGTVTCTLTSTTSAPVQLTATAPQGGTVTATLVTDPPDPDPLDNRDDVELDRDVDPVAP
ncbi:MAG: sigma-70 region 2 domain protein [uncultured Nocardioides sp.]|uniref:Sigma-70 region 2 domain protein n=1 Tax=uncultured Nocardioides sp. TaxID=198441 RepID=A0A6J4MX10_9ACTN|nr:MAG: sigma-70 region 2 domain protein [uncultured Nocardioides sp.]